MKTVDVTENWGKLMADLDSTRKELDLNKKLLARQCDLSREAETELEELRENVNTMTVALKLCTQPLYSFEPIGAAYKAVKSALAAVEKKANTIKYGEGWGPPDCSTAAVEKGEG